MSVYTYEWAGDPNASESIKYVDGVEVARNLGYPLVPFSTQSIFATNQDYPSPGEVEVLTTGETESRSLPRIQRVNANETTPPIFPGQGYAMAVQVKHSRGLPVRIRAWFLDASGAHIRNIDGSYAEGTEYGRSVISGTAPENAAHLGFQITVDSSVEDGPSVEGDLFWAKDLHVAIATTENDALSQVADYFDGDTPTHSDSVFKVWHKPVVTHEWAGEPHASVSIKRVDGVEVARNRNRSPSFETSGASGGAALVERTNEWSASGQYSIKVTPTLGYRGSGYTELANHNSININPSPGEWVGVRATLYKPDPQEAGEIDGVYMEGDRASAPFEAGEHVLRAAFKVPEGSWYLRTYHRGTNQDPAIFWDAIAAYVADTEAEAFDLTSEYFDGDTPSYKLDGEWRLVPTLVCKGEQFHHANIKKFTDGAYR